MKTIHQILRELGSLEERAHLNTLAAAFEAARTTFAARGGGVAIVVWLDDGDPLVLTSHFAKFAVVARWLSTTQIVPAAPATPRNGGDGT